MHNYILNKAKDIEIILSHITTIFAEFDKELIKKIIRVKIKTDSNVINL